MTRPLLELEVVEKLVESQMNDCAIARLTGIPRTTIRDWRAQGRTAARVAAQPHPGVGDCPICDGADLDAGEYAYLLGLYLGDGCLTPVPRGVFKLRIFLDARYPGIIDECAAAMKGVRTNSTMSVGRTSRSTWYEIYSCWKHWPCLFPQHGPGRKHLRDIRLRHWQEDIASANPDLLLRGLIHSDGCRDLNWVNGKSYPRYSFANNSEDIRNIFCQACDDLGVSYSFPYWKTVSIARRPDVERLDAFIGPKE